MKDAYHHIYDGEIFQQSQCIWHENVLLDWLRSQLIHLGYASTGESNKLWQREDRTVITCVVDDIITCNDGANPYVPRLWDGSTAVVTDNQISCPTLYTVHQLPPSWFGIYAYVPKSQIWLPDRRFNLSMNRLDMKRMLLYLEYRKRLPWGPEREVMDYVNFNCWSWQGDNSCDEGLKSNCDRIWQSMDPLQLQAYDSVYQTDHGQMPWRNHDFDNEAVMHRCWINLVIETYSGDLTIALSEKIFRALVTPAPWMVYAGRFTITYLESLGFDCLSDILDHGYDRMIETHTVDYGDKIVDWFWNANENYARLQNWDFDKLSVRCQAAAAHNQSRLKAMRQQWPADLAAWWPNVVSTL